MQFKILQSFGNDSVEWTHLIAKLKPGQQDLHFLPEYGNIYQQTYGYVPFLAFYGNDNRFMIQVFVKRSLNELPFLKDQKITEPFFDIANPYGYGGPLCQCNSSDEGDQLFKEFQRHLIDYCLQNKIASEFTCFHPLLDNHRYGTGSGLITTDYQKEVVYLDLAESEEELWLALNRGHKSGINKARKLKVRVAKMAPCPANFEIFKGLYYQTMLRHNASARWFFPDDYFWNSFLGLGSERVSLFFALVNETPAAAYFLIHDFSTLYYHFGGSDSTYNSFRPNNLLMFEVALWAKRNGFTRYHLGGGVTSSATDSLFQFKAGFSKKLATVYSYHRIHHQEIYHYLCSLKKQHERMNGAANGSDYFPLYRR
jgi:hypothetical protein